MPTYATVSWQDGDEVTSAKLQQMAQNEQYMKDNLIIGNTTIEGQGVNSVLKMECIKIPFDSTSTVQVFVFRVNLPPVFTEPPVIVFSHNVMLYFTIVQITETHRTDYCEFYMAEKDSQIVRFQGELNIIAVGK